MIKLPAESMMQPAMINVLPKFFVQNISRVPITSREEIYAV